jgi:hypothetical protein
MTAVLAAMSQDAFWWGMVAGMLWALVLLAAGLSLRSGR